jgi:hypothetical protein
MTLTSGNVKDDERIQGTAYYRVLAAFVAQTWTRMLLSAPFHGSQQRSNASQLAPFVSELRIS